MTKDEEKRIVDAAVLETDKWISAFKTDGNYNFEGIMKILRKRKFEQELVLPFLARGPEEVPVLAILGASVVELENDIQMCLLNDSFPKQPNKLDIKGVFNNVDWKQLEKHVMKEVGHRVWPEGIRKTQKRKKSVWNMILGHKLSSEVKTALRSAYMCLWDYYDMAFCESIYMHLPKKEHEFLDYPMFPAYKEGLGFVINLGSLIVGIVLPETHRNEQNQLHNPSAPAIFWKDEGTKKYWWNNVEVNKRIIEESHLITAKEIINESNQELKRIMLEKMGYEKIVLELDGKVIQQDDFGKLVETKSLGDGDTIARFVDVSCPSTDRRYFIRVGPDARSCREAIAATFNMEADNYWPTMET
jgi:hypothetical protein